MTLPIDPNKTLTIERTFNAPLPLVWDVWTSAAHIPMWWGLPDMPFDVIKHDFTEGRSWKYIMKMPNGMQMVSEGQFIEIVKHDKVITTANFRPMTENVEMHALFAADGDSTNLTFHIVHETEAYAKQQEEMGFKNGWGSTFNRMEALLTKLVAGG